MKRNRHILNFVCIAIISFLPLMIFAASNASSSAFNEMLTAQPTPVIQLQFPYNVINSAYATTTTTGSGTATASNSFAVMSTTAASSSSATLASRMRLHYQSGQGCSSVFTAIFTTGVTGSSQIIGIGNTQDGFFFGYDPTTANFGIMSRRNSVDTWVDQANWNGDTLNGSGASGVTLVPTNGNVYKIQYQWLGFGVIKFYVEKSADGTWILAHTILYPNSTTQTSLINPSLQLWASATNTTNNTAITLKTSSMSGIIEGVSNSYLDTRNGYNVSNSSITTTIANLLSIQNNSTYNSVTNQVLAYPNFLVAMTTGDAILTLYLNPTLGGTNTFTNIGSNSVVSYNTAATITTKGKVLYTCYCANQFIFIDLNYLNLILVPGDILMLAATSTAGTITVYAGLSWREDF